MDTIHLGDLIINVDLKDIKNIHLSVYPPIGRVRISAPLRMDLDAIRVFFGAGRNHCHSPVKNTTTIIYKPYFLLDKQQ